MPTITVTPHRNPYAQRTEYRVTVHGIGSRAGYLTVEDAEEAGRLIETGALVPVCPACGWAGEPTGPKADAHRLWHWRGTRLLAVAGAGRLMGR